ncbi:MAG: vanadium-dependent haloperoxidase [Planctomycetota bacterium]|jgi:hypothetical protein
MKMTTLSRTLVLAGCLLAAAPASAQEEDHSVARQWNEMVLEAIRDDYARPTVHARNLFHTSVAMWDAWAAYDDSVATYLHHERASAEDVEAAREEAMSYACFRIIAARFDDSPGAEDTQGRIESLMDDLGYDDAVTTTTGDTPAALGNRIAATILTFGETDGANEENDYENLIYRPVNTPLLPAFPGNPNIDDRNRWQPLALEFFIDQSGNVFPSATPDFLSPEWGIVTPFALSVNDRDVFKRDGDEWVVYHDPGPPPLLGSDDTQEYMDGFTQVVEWSALLDPTDGVMIDIGPGARGNNTLGTNDGTGHTLNPATGQPYEPNMVPAGDYYRVLAEFWADGPDSETPPGHWFTLANYVSDHEDVVKRIGGQGPVVSDLEWDVKIYLAMGGAMHDCAISAWGVKGWYDYVRPVSAIRAMADLGQSTDAQGPSYHPEGIPLVDDVIEVITNATIAEGQRHEHLAGNDDENVGKIAFYAWRGPAYISEPETVTAGFGLIVAERWWPYQRPSFVTPPFAGYVSGHSTYSRAAAVVMAQFTGDEYFPGGMGTFEAPQNEFLVFEEGPSVDITLQWATYADAADECSLSRIYGGIHPRADDIPGRLMGAKMGPDAVTKMLAYAAPDETVVFHSVKSKAKKSGKGTFTIKGTLTASGGTSGTLLEAADGAVLTMHDEDGFFAASAVEPRRVKVKKSGRIKARSQDKRFKLACKPVKGAPGDYSFVIKLKLDEFDGVLVGPLSLTLRAGKTVVMGSVEE